MPRDFSAAFSRQACVAAALAIALGGASGAARADTLFGLYAGVGQWESEPSGHARSGDTRVDLETDLDLGEERNDIAYLRVEHGVPLLPNLRLNYAGLRSDGRNTLGRDIVFEGQEFSVAETVSSQVDLTQIDAIFYYELLDNVVSLDLGVAARWIDGEVSIRSATESARADFTGVLPMLYARSELALPFGLWVAAEVQGVAYSGNRLVDGSAQLGWRSGLGLGAELGWRRYELKLDDFDDMDSARIEFDGPYLAVNFHF